MTVYWQPIAASYFERVSMERILQAVREGVSEQQAQNIARMKKPTMPEAACLSPHLLFRRPASRLEL
jgi:ParB family transcriptional regulator, chromosome partitioning protein